ncbi:MAG: hypothetical protein ACODAQ_03300 [Phycisphaeraceae bacterium]
MLTWLLKWIGVSDTVAQRVSEAQWLWARPAVLWVGVVLLVPAAVFIARRHKRALPYVSAPARGVLTCCRVGVLAVLVFVVAQPYLRLSETVTRKPIVAVLLDESASMDLPAGAFEGEDAQALAMTAGLVERREADEPEELTAEQRKTLNNLTRAELAQRVLGHHEGTLLAELRERFELRTYRFARAVQQAALVDAMERADGAARDDTAIGDALRTATAETAGRTLAGIVLLTDGRNTAGPAVGEVMRGGADAPVWAVPVGSGEAMADISLVDVLAPRQVARGDTAAIVATVRSHGFAGREVQVTLRERGQTLDEQALVLRDHERQQVDLTFNADAAGARMLEVAVETLEAERIAANNAQVAAVQVDEQQWQVLYLEGYPRWDFRFLDHALRRDGGIDARLVMEAHLLAERAAQKTEDDEAEISPLDLPTMARLPEDAAGFAEYHAVMLGDVSPALLPRRLQAQLAKAVREEGVGLVVQGGPEYMPHAYVDGPLAEVLPVRLDEDESGAGMNAPAYAPYRMAVTAVGSIHPALRLYDSATKNRGVWSRMPPFYWAAATRRAAPGATVLAEVEMAEGMRPLIAEHFAGRGRVIFIGSDATYRWRRNIGDHLFYRFWGQALRHVAKAKERRGDESWIEVHPPRVAPGEAVSIEMHAVDENGAPVNAERVGVRVRREDASEEEERDWETVELARGAEPGHYRGRWRGAAAGTYRVGSVDDESVSAVVRVAASGRELIEPTVDRDALGALGERTGGGLLELWQIGAVADRLEGEAVEVVEVEEAELWDNWLTLVVLVGLYCLDVLVRRLTGVV